MKTASPFIALFAALVVLLPVNLGADNVPAAAHLRFWKTALPAMAHVRVSFKAGAGKHATAVELGSAGPGFSFNNYVDTPSGHIVLEVYVDSNKAPLVSLPTDFAAGTFATVLLKEPRKAGAPPQVEIVVDDKEGEPDGLDTTAQIRVRSFVAGVKDIRLTMGDALSAQFTGNGSYLQMRGLKPAVYPVRTVGTGTDGKPFEWTTETDLRQHHSQTLLIFPDPYGRIRPRLSIDGEAPPPDDGGQR